ncbi:site-specific integrase [Modestobacter marinus]|uniref:Integrase n=1 Tax=Modestobacter marinus TaxID=477641 RepID=A0A846M386_9ACTN|nr:integrase [Modestobacter marinus]GGL83971.1 phage integrase [Modestobacter marinus]
MGTFGRIGFLLLSSGEVQARARFRDFDGRTRLVSKTGTTRAAAERALKTELAARRGPGGAGVITASSRVSALVEAWLAADHGWSTGTERTYRSVIRTSVLPAFGQLTLQEVTPGRVGRALTAIAKASGPGAAKTARACLSGMFSHAIDDGAITANPVRDATVRIDTTAKKAPRALTVDQTARLVELFRGSARANDLDLPDIVDWMLATGARIGEAVALRTGETAGQPLLDLEAGTWEVNATAVRVPKQGMVVQPRTKTAAGWRIIAVPELAVDVVRRRLTSPHRPDTELVFPAPLPAPCATQTACPVTCASCWTPSSARPAAGPASSRRQARRRPAARSAAPRGRGRGLPRAPSARPSPPAWTRPGSRHGRSPTSSATPTPR